MASDPNHQTDSSKRTPFEILKIQLRALEKMKERSPLPSGELEIRIGEIRFQLRRLYPDNLTILEVFPTLQPKADIAIAQEHFHLILGRLRSFLNYFDDAPQKLLHGVTGNKIFIGHGRSAVWREVKDFVVERLRLPWDEFNREAVAGLTTVERWSQMLEEASFAFLIMTAEDEHADSTMHARENVIHEVGLFQGRLGPRRAIILLEEGCKEFSNVHGLSQIRFARGRVSAVFEEMRRVLEREGIIRT